MSAPKPRRWFRYSLRTLFIVMTVVCLVCGFWLNKAFRQREAVRRFNQLTTNRSHAWGVAVGYRSTGDALHDSHANPARFHPLRTALGEEAFGEVIAVNLNRTTATDGDLRYLIDLPMVEHIWLEHTKVTDQGMKSLHACPKLKVLILDNTAITDEGLAKLQDLRGLTNLYLDGTQITDAGLEHLEKLASLRELWLHDTAITDAGYRKLRAALGQCEISADVPSYDEKQNLRR